MCANRRERDTDRCRARNARGNETKTRERNTKRSGVLPEVFPKRDEASEDESDDRGRESHGQTLGGGKCAREEGVWNEEEEEEDKSKTDKEEASEERKQQGGPTKAQKRREKKAAEEKARELAIEMERARLRESGPSKKEIEEEAMRRALKALDLTLREVKADGHCLYRAVAEQVDEMKEESRYGEVRTMCKDEMLKNREEYEAFVEMEEAGSYEKYCEKVGSTAEWGGHVEMLAIARALRRNVEVFEVRPGGEVEKMVVECVGSGVEGEEGKGGSSFPLRVAFMKESYTLGEHYDAVVSL
jgi:OTU domain-containing protein 6